MPARPHANRGASFQTLVEAPPASSTPRGGERPDALKRYGERLAIPLRPDRPAVILNFVSSLDGVVTLDPDRGSGAEISGYSEPDRFVMGLLRTLADIIIVGAGTLRAAARHEWTPRHVNRGYAEAYREWRGQLGFAPQPTTVIVTASGNVPPD